MRHYLGAKEDREMTELEDIDATPYAGGMGRK